MARRKRTHGDEPTTDAADLPGQGDAKPETPAETAAEPPSSPFAETPSQPAVRELPEIEPPEPKAEPWPDATPPPMEPVEPGEEVARTRTSTVAMPVVGSVGRPPEMPKTSAPPPLVLGTVEDPTHMPGPKELPAGLPDDPAPPPGRVPPGDSRSLRYGSDFALVYRLGTYVITRVGRIGTRGQWRVVEYPTSASASHAYAKEASRFVTVGFTDYRD